MINAAFLFDKYNDNIVFGEKNRDFFLVRCLICVIRMKSPSKETIHNFGLLFHQYPLKSIFSLSIMVTHFPIFFCITLK
ncbi:MAG: hypothetical protein FD170_1343 [Bacteroidetes bacterium]|nr:MAG: hypothetical protein FD170_1343 [Bacteroidota bacterium]